MNLPEKFLEEMRCILGNEINEYKQSLSECPHHGLRLNTSKITEDEFNELINWQPAMKRVEWCSSGFYYDEAKYRVTKSPYYYAGLYYVQEPSAMLPASILPIEKGDRVLDLCAAPGGKSTQLAVKLNGTGFLFANDISNTRAKALLKNLELFGMPNIAVTCESHEKLCESFPEFFDKILVDAPCSGEGMFRREPAMVNSWLEKGPDYYANIQADILEHAYNMLKPGGMLLYSTCTFSPCENEGNIIKLLGNHMDAELVPIEITEGMRHGLCDEILNKFNIFPDETHGNNILTGCARIFPNDGLGEGHFAALIHKRIMDSDSSGSTKNNINIFPDNSKDRKAILNLNKKLLSRYPKAAAFFKNISDSFLSGGEIIEINNRLYMLPDGLEIHEGIRYLRTGLLLGEVIKKPAGKKSGPGNRKKQTSDDINAAVRFEPSQALAMTLNKNLFSNTVDFKAEDTETIKYLKGETINCPIDCAAEDGWCLVTLNGYPLGFAVKNKDTLKNKYYPGWRLQ